MACDIQKVEDHCPNLYNKMNLSINFSKKINTVYCIGSVFMGFKSFHFVMQTIKSSTYCVFQYLTTYKISDVTAKPILMSNTVAQVIKRDCCDTQSKS